VYGPDGGARPGAGDADDDGPPIGATTTAEAFYGRYELRRLLGKGSFGEVWMATDAATGATVAVKKIRYDPKSARLVQAEVDAMHACGQHRHVVELLDVYEVAAGKSPRGGREPRHWAIVMELCEGGGLFEHLVQQGAYSERVAALLMQQFARALYHLHSKGVVHRDIKPENLVLKADDFLKLIDFGTAVVLQEGEQVASGGRCGTTGYWAPEQLEQRPYGTAVDLWAAGVVLFILLSGYHPFDPDGEATADEVRAAMLAGRYDFDAPEWRNVSRQAKGLVRSLLELDPDKRCTAADLVNHPWIRGERVSDKPLPATHERLRAYTKARHAFHGSILLGILMHQVRGAQAQADSSGGGLAISGARAVHPEGGGAERAGAEFDALRIGFELFDKDNKGHITSADLRRVCDELGYEISERELHNMMAVLAPTDHTVVDAEALPQQAAAAARSGVRKLTSRLFGGAEAGPAPPEPAASRPSAGRTITFESYARALNRSHAKLFKTGDCVFRQGDDVDGFYIITRGGCRVVVRGREGPEVEIARLGPGDFFGETGILEGRAQRSSSVVCVAPTEVLFMDRRDFQGLLEYDKSGHLARGMHERAEARQQARMAKLLAVMSAQAERKRHVPPGAYVHKQGDVAENMFQVLRGTLRQTYTTQTGESVCVTELGPGAYFGYDSLLSGVHDTDVFALTESELAVLPVALLRPAMDESEWLQSTMRWRAEYRAEYRQNMAARSESQLLATMAKVAERRGEPLEIESYQKLTEGAERLHLDRGQPVFRQGDRPTHVYLVEDGELQAHYKTEKGSERVLAEFRRGDHFGETAFVDGRDRRNTSVTCASAACELRALPHQAWRAMLKRSPQLDAAVREAAALRSRSRLRTIIELAAANGRADALRCKHGEVVFKQVRRAGRPRTGRPCPAHTLPLSPRATSPSPSTLCARARCRCPTRRRTVPRCPRACTARGSASGPRGPSRGAGRGATQPRWWRPARSSTACPTAPSCSSCARMPTPSPPLPTCRKPVSC